MLPHELNLTDYIAGMWGNGCMGEKWKPKNQSQPKHRQHITLFVWENRLWLKTTLLSAPFTTTSLSILTDNDVNVWSAIISSSIIIPSIVYLSKQCQSVLYRQVSSPNLTLRHKPHSHTTFPKYCIGRPSLQILPQEYIGSLPSLGITPTRHGTYIFYLQRPK